jgi:hypothetical protein
MRTVVRIAMLVFVASLLGPLLAAEIEPRDRFSFRQRLAMGGTPHPRPERRREFKRSNHRLRNELHRVEVPMESLSAFHNAVVPGESLSDHIMFEQLSDEVSRGFLRATKRALKDYMLESVELDRVIDRIRRRRDDRRQTRAGARSQHGRRRLDFDVGIHSFVPEVEMTYRVSGGDVSLEVNAEGEIGMRYRAGGRKFADVGIGFGGDGSFGFSFRCGF